MINFNFKEKRALIITVVLLVLLWTLGPYIAIAGHAFFASKLINLLITLVAIGGVFGYFLSKRLRLNQKFENKHLPLNEAVIDLESQMQVALDSIHIRKHTNLLNYLNTSKSKPWILLIGPNGCGKTSLLANSGIALHSPNKKTLDHLSPTQSIDWWISDYGVFIDPAAKYCMSTETQPNEQNQWQHFLRNLATQHTPLFDSVCLCIDLPSLLCDDGITFDTLINQIHHQIFTLAPLNKPLCLNLIITQCDHMSGFAEFYSSLSKDEQQNSLGISLFDPENTAHKNDLFRTRFKEFITAQNLRLCKRLHHERNLERRKRIALFPMQLERLLNPISKILNIIPDNPRIVVNNVFFCSSQQSANTYNLFRDELHQAFQIEKKPSAPLIANQQSLFLHDMLIKITEPRVPDTAFAEKAPTQWWHILSYPTALALVFSLTALFHHLYQKNANYVKTIQQELVSLKQTNWLVELDLLTKTKTQLNSFNTATSEMLGFDQVHRLKLDVDKAYQHTLTTQFTKYLNQILRDEVKIESDNNSPSLYNTLRAYLMLANTQRLNKAFIENWFSRFWQKQLPQDKNSQANLNKYLLSVLQLDSINWPQDKAVINNAQMILQKQPLAQIAFKILYNENDTTNIPVKETANIEGINLQTATIPKFYSLSQFKQVYQKQIPAFAKLMLKGNWVLGKPLTENQNLTQLVADLRALYVQHYVNQWQESLSQISLKQPNSFSLAENEINLVTNAQSPLWQLYQRVLQNAHAAGADVSNQALLSYMPGESQAKPMLQALTNLQSYLKQIGNAPSSAKASFAAASTRFQTNGANDAITQVLATANNMPTPIKEWMQTLAKNSWKLMLNQTQIYLNAMWQTNVAPVYKQTIQNRFPINKNTKEDITIDHFNQFFGPGGTIQTFFNDNLAPFINMSNSYWTWKKLDDESLPISQSTLDMLIRASMIQKMFYSHGADHPSFNFKLMPLSMSDNTNQFILNIGGQMIQYMPGLKKAANATWPGNDGNFVTMRFNNPSENNPTLTTMGPWAWLRLLNTATITGSSDEREFEVNFHLKNSQATYQLTADNPINPYLSGVLTKFRCPETL